MAPPRPQQHLLLVTEDRRQLCGAVGLFRGVVYVTCGLATGHQEEACSYAENPLGPRTIDREPVDQSFVVPVPYSGPELMSLAELLRNRPRIAVG